MSNVNSSNMQKFWKSIVKNFKGILLCFGFAIPAWCLGKLVPVIGGPIFAILIGIIIGTLLLKNKGDFSPGISFTSKKLLQLAVILLGFGMNITEILTRGKQSLPIILITITVSLIVAFILMKLLKAEKNTSTLIGVGSSICGGSAIAATAPVIDANDEEIAQSISVVFLFNVVAALIFPALGSLLGMSNEGFAFFAGTAINDTSSVTSAAAAWDGIHGSNVLETATIVKLTRTLAIIPITLILGFWSSRKKKIEGEVAGKIKLKSILPMFIIFFVLASIITTVFKLPADITAPLKEASKFFIIMAMCAIGLNTDIKKLIHSGGKPIIIGLCCWVSIIAASLAMQAVLGIW